MEARWQPSLRVPSLMPRRGRTSRSTSGSFLNPSSTCFHAQEDNNHPYISFGYSSSCTGTSACGRVKGSLLLITKCQAMCKQGCGPGRQLDISCGLCVGMDAVPEGMVAAGGRCIGQCEPGGPAHTAGCRQWQPHGRHRPLGTARGDHLKCHRQCGAHLCFILISCACHFTCKELADLRCCVFGREIPQLCCLHHCMK